jgi:hypothetical protein
MLNSLLFRIVPFSSLYRPIFYELGFRRCLQKTELDSAETWMGTFSEQSPGYHHHIQNQLVSVIAWLQQFRLSSCFRLGFGLVGPGPDVAFSIEQNTDLLRLFRRTISVFSYPRQPIVERASKRVALQRRATL